MAVEIKQKAFVLHSRPYRETSLLVTFFTEDKGKLNSIVKGVKSNSKAAKLKNAWLQPFQELNLSWLEKNKAFDLINLRLLEPTNVRFPLFADASICGLYVNELLYRLLFQSVASPVLYKQYQQVLFELAKTKNRQQQAWVLRKFEYNLLVDLGIAINMEFDAVNKLICADSNYQFVLEVGFIKVEKHNSQISGKILQDFIEQKYNEDCLPALKYLFRFVLSHYLGNKPINTRNLFN